MKTPEVVFIGEAAVTNKNGAFYVLAINTNTDDIELELSPQEIVPFKYDLEGEEYFD